MAEPTLKRGSEGQVVKDLEELVLHERQLHPGVPVVLFGHSMGSYLSQWFLTEHADLLRGAILSATAGKRARVYEPRPVGSILSPNLARSAHAVDEAELRMLPPRPARG